MVVLYSTNCPKCKVMELKLKQKNIDFRVETDPDIVVNKGKEVGIISAPILNIDDKYFDFVNGVKELNKLN